MHLQASYTYLCGSYFHCNDVTLGDTGHFFQELAKEKRRVPGLLKIQKQCCGHALFQDLRKLSQDEWGKTLDTIEATTILEKNLNQSPFLICIPWVLPVKNPFSDFLDNNFLGEEVKLVKATP